MYSPAQIEAIEDDLYQLNLSILAAEDWSHEYDKDPKAHAQLIKLEAGMERNLRRYFRTMSADASKFVSWIAYNNALTKQILAADYSVDVIVLDEPLDESDNTFLKLVFDDIATGAAIGASYGEAVYTKPLALTKTSSEIQQFAREQVAKLVGKKLDKDGHIVDNPNADYRISNTTRKDIQESIKTSLSLGEDQQAATERLMATINNPKRAELIAQTEAVNSFQGGLLTFGKKSGAVGKESQSLGATDQCAEYAAMGTVDIDYKYGGLFDGPAYHPRCRCGLRMVYTEELNQ